jgi:hypothetical protein
MTTALDLIELLGVDRQMIDSCFGFEEEDSKI